MKVIIVNLIVIFFSNPLFCQQTTQIDNASLLGYYQNQRYEEAFNYLKKNYPEPVTEVKILSSLAYSSAMAGKLPEAEDYYQRVYLTDTTNTAILFNMGGINARRGNNLRAIAFYKKILSRDSTNFNVFKQIANLTQNMGNTPDAIAYFQKANKINPAEPDVAYDLTSFYIKAKLYKKADTVVTIALKADTVNLLLLLGKAQIDYRLDKYPETVAVCKQLEQSGNQSSEVINMLGISWYNLKKYVNCITTLNLLEKSNTASETSCYYTAMSYKALRRQDSAIIYFKKAIKEAMSPNVNSYYGEMADSYDRLHQLKNAVYAYQKSLLYGFAPLTYYALAYLFDTELKKKALALRYYKKYLGSNPPKGQRSYMAYAEKRIRESTLH